MSSFGSYDSLLCSSPSDCKNFSSSTDENSQCTSMNSLNMIATNDAIINVEDTKPNDGQNSLPKDPPDAVEIMENDVAVKELNLERGENNGRDEGSRNECGSSKTNEAAVVEEFGCSSNHSRLNRRKRLREECVNDEDAEDDNEAIKKFERKAARDAIEENNNDGNGEEEDEHQRIILNTLSSSSSSSSSSNSSFSEESHNFLAEIDRHSDTSEEEIEDDDMIFHGGFFFSRTNKPKRDVNDKTEAKLTDEALNFHKKILKLNLKREYGFPHKKSDGVSAYQGSIVGDPDVVRKFGLFCKYEEHAGCVNSLHFNETGNLIASGSDDTKVVIHDWIKQKIFISFQSHHKSNIFQTKFMPHSRDSHLVTCARDGQVRLSQLSSTGTCRNHKKLATHKGAAHKLALIMDSAHEFYSCGEDGVTYQIDLRQDKPSMSFVTKHKGKRVALYSIHANPMKSYEICVVGRDPYVRIYDIRNVDKDNLIDTSMKKFCPDNLQSGYDHITAAVYNYNGTEIVASYNDDDIYLFDSSFSNGASYIKQYCGHRNSATVKGVNFYGPKSEYVVSGSDCGHVFIWDKETSRIVNVFHADEAGVVNVIENHPTLALIATSGLDSDVKLWMPSKRSASLLDQLNNILKKNKRRKSESRLSAEFDDGRLLWFLMRTLRRRRADDDSTNDDDDDVDDDNGMPIDNDGNDPDEHDDNDDDNLSGTRRHNIQCASS